jgi:general secretion pathway protein A
MEAISIVTDSSCDLPQAILAQHAVTVVPLVVRSGEKVFLDSELSSEQFWGLAEKPFENSPDPRFLYPAVEHRHAVDLLCYAVRQQKGAALLTGEYGCGKTLLIRVLVQELEKDAHIAVITYPRLTGTELLREVLFQLGTDLSTGSRQRLVRAIGELLHANVRRGGHTVVIVDEAQVIDKPAILDELRLLLNYQLNDRFLLTLILVGQPELRERVAALPQLDQRIAVKTHLHTFDLVDTAKYIAYRLAAAGAARAVFKPDAVESIYEHSYGCPRRINNLGDLCLWNGFQKKVSEIGADIVESVA